MHRQHVRILQVDLYCRVLAHELLDRAAEGMNPAVFRAEDKPEHAKIAVRRPSSMKALGRQFTTSSEM
jgi:hypothetical protein